MVDLAEPLLEDQVVSAPVAAMDRTLLDVVPPPGPWSRLGRCRGLSPTLFFPERGQNLGPARTVCAGCPVRSECLEYALDYPALTGIWGGTSAQQRRALRATREADRARAEASAVEAQVQRAAAGALDANLLALIAHPGAWARVARFGSAHSGAAMASMYRTGRRTPPPGRWQMEGRLNDEGGSDLYACFLGAEGAEAS